ncbi:MAG: Gfo/Idh/MocA family oxidoreductase [Planctomycetes bacterium]|nr:Gfo/Idh/MocA family oxidoreductase [Planctomycetota bacterium]
MSIRVGVIGCGMIARFHFSGLEKAKATVRWICDLKAENTAAWVGTGARVTTDWREVVADPQVDAVVVATVSRLHKEICLAAIAAGKAVICEKTLTENAEDSWEVVSRAEAAGVPFFTSYMKRWFEAAQQAKRLLPSLGRIVSTHVRSHQPWGDTWTGALPAREPGAPASAAPSHLVSTYGGGMLVMGGSHVIDLTLYLLGRPTRLFALQYIPGDRDFDLHVSALLETPTDGTISYEALASPLSRTGFLRDGWDEQIEITGTGGKLTLLTPLWSHVEQKTALLIHDDEASGQRHEYRYGVDSPFDRAIGAFVADIAAGTQTAQSRITGYEVDQVIASMVASARSGQRVVIPWRG